MNVHGKHITVIGAARSGIAVAELLTRNGAKVFVSDSKSIGDESKSRLISKNIAFEENTHSGRALEADLAVVSPGVPSTAFLVKSFIERGKPVFSEIEVASWFNKTPIVGVTGTNGKTTTTAWLDHMWQTAKIEHKTGGNIGWAFSEFADAKDFECTLLEISSFQLDFIDKFAPKVSVILNITPDHLDRYENSFEKYAASKFRIFENQTSNDIFIYGWEDVLLRKKAAELAKRDNAPQIWTFSSEILPENGAGIKDGNFCFSFNGKEEVIMPQSQIAIKGTHNIRNGMAAALAARAMEVDTEYIRESLKSFAGVHHRLEFVRELDNVRYYNDSKATNVNSVWYALESFEDPIVLILGGQDKGNNYAEIAQLVRKKVRAVIALGASRQKVADQLGGIAHSITLVDSMDEAVSAAREKAKPFDVVLLSPACASFDMFQNYEHRGQVFKTLVNQL